jgi:histidyl-tRNA synthetase
VTEVFDYLRGLLAAYTFTPLDEADLQDQVATVLATAGVDVDREVLAAGGRYDLLARTRGVRVVLELKVTGSAPSVERQAQRYALTDDVDAVVIVTTSNRLARALARVGGETLGGKPFAVIALRGF